MESFHAPKVRYTTHFPPICESNSRRLRSDASFSQRIAIYRMASSCPCVIDFFIDAIDAGASLRILNATDPLTQNRLILFKNSNTYAKTPPTLFIVGCAGQPLRGISRGWPQVGIRRGVVLSRRFHYCGHGMT